MFRSSRRQSAPDFDLLVPEARPKRTEKRFFDNDVVDADFIEVREEVSRPADMQHAPQRLRPSINLTHQLAPLLKPLFGNIERRLSRLSVDGFAAVIAAAFIGVFVVSGGFSLFSSDVAVAAKPFNPLGISYVNITPQLADGQEVLIISGVIENHGEHKLEVPQILASLGATKGEFVASMIIQAPIAEIEPGNSHGFSAKLRHPGGKTPEIKLSFMQTDVSQR